MYISYGLIFQLLLTHKTENCGEREIISTNIEVCVDLRDNEKKYIYLD